MVTYYNRKDLVAFGNYVLSVERERISKLEESGEDQPLPGHLPEMTHANIENWKRVMILNKSHDVDQ